ncbi:MAG: DUF6261 family protein [Tannerellaceae bacterium]|nr:DUF6261 family protein [Tannerellaceae bacterium]
MKKIVGCQVVINRLKNDEHCDFYDNVTGFVRAQGTGLPEVASVWMTLCELFEKEYAIHRRNGKRRKIKLLKEAGQKRSVTCMMIKLVINSAINSDEPTEREAAGKLVGILNKHNSVYAATDSEASPLVHKMIRELKSPRYFGSIVTLGLDDALDKLEEKNEEFKSIYTEYFLNNEDNKNLGSMKSIRPLVDNAFRSFTISVNAMYFAGKLDGKYDAENPYTFIIDFINGYINQYKRIYTETNKNKK